MDISSIPAWLQAVLLGLIQGLTEFLPVSSSAHLVILPELGDWAYMGKSFDVALHFGTLVAIIAYFREDVMKLLVGCYGLLVERKIGDDAYRRMALLLVLGTVPVAIVGLLLEDQVEEWFNGIGSISTMLVVFGLLLLWADRQGSQKRGLWSLNWTEVLTIGVVQALALMPGVSRSGATMTAGMFLGLTREEAARFSFLLSLPAIAGAAGLKAIRLLNDPEMAATLVPTLVGTVTAAISGFLCIHYLLRFLRKQSFLPFVVYRVALGIALFVWLR